jgi:2'-5' RNA ligase
MWYNSWRDDIFNELACNSFLHEYNSEYWRHRTMLVITSGKVSTSSQVKREFSNTQISVPSTISSKVQTWSKKHIAESIVYTDPNDPSFGRETDSHVTVKFGLHTNNARDVEEVVSGFSVFTVKLGEVSKFSSEEYDVIKIDVHSEKLHELNALISKKLECTDTHPTYKPHLTIAYVKKGSCDDLLGDKVFKGSSWEVSEIEFSSKNHTVTILTL